VTASVGVLAMAYGTPGGPDDVERYYTDIRGGRAPSPPELRDLRDRYAAIGNRFPLLEITRRQGRALERELNAEGRSHRVYLGMKHSLPSIEDGVERMRAEGIERAVGLVLAPHWSGMSVETYVQRVEKALAEGGPEFTFVRSWYAHAGFVDFLASRTVDALSALDARHRRRATAVFSAHSLPIRTIQDGTSRCSRCEACPDRCRYVDELHHSAKLVAARAGLDSYRVAWQSAGRTEDAWWGPSLQEVTRDLAAEGRTAMVVCSAGFVADHLEILYDLDIEARRGAEDVGLAFARTEMPNDHPDFVRALASVVREHLDTGAWSEP
jgi:ferrochelatase